ncbi:MAG: M1 family peptidase [Chloroflexota bacterium]|nr:M1 family peptidase [Chloroflexota bacterium]
MKQSCVLLCILALLLTACGGRSSRRPAPTAVGQTLPSSTSTSRLTPTAPSPGTPAGTSSSATVGVTVTPATPTEATATVETTPAPDAMAARVVRGRTSPRCQLARQGPADREGLGDPLFPQLGNGGYDALHYTLDLSVDVSRGALSGTATMTARAVQDLLALNVDLEGLTVQRVDVNGARAKYSRAGRELSIALPEEVRRGERFDVRVTYGGVPDPTIEGAPTKTGWINYEGGSYVVSEPAGAATWYPVNDHPCDKAAYTFRITVPEPYVVAANGLLRTTRDNGNTRTYHWEARDPMASYLATVGIGRFTTQTQRGPGGLPIRNYFPADLADSAPQIFARTPEVVQFFNRLFGPYPFEAYGVVVVDEELGFALETQTLSVFGRDAIENRGFAEVALVHELAHQWFGNSVSLKRWGDIWLNEGFATYAELLWVESQQGRAELDRRLREVYSAGGQGTSLVPVGRQRAENLFNPAVYYGGALTLHALRVRVGDESFFRILRTYYDRYRDGNAGTEDFIAVAEEVSGRDLHSFFAAWLYGEELPPIPEMGLGG